MGKDRSQQFDLPEKENKSIQNTNPAMTLTAVKKVSVQPPDPDAPEAHPVPMIL